MQQLLMQIWQQNCLPVILVTHDAGSRLSVRSHFVMGLNPSLNPARIPVPCGAAIDASIMPTTSR